MLAALLPGFREVRGPLVAGFLWLLFVWLTFDIDFPPADQVAEGEPLERIYELAPLVQGVGSTVVLSVAAYLVGSLAIAALGLPARNLAGVGRSMGLSGGDTPMTEWSRDAFRRIEAGLVADAKRAQQAQLMELSNARKVTNEPHVIDDLDRELHTLLEPNIGGIVKRAVVDLGADFDVAHQTLRYDFEATKTQILAVNPTLHAEVDRRDNEAAFRLAIAPPIAAIGITLAAGSDGLWALLIVVSVAVAAHGIELRRQTANSLALALRSLPQVEPPALLRFRDSIRETLPEDVQELIERGQLALQREQQIGSSATMG